MRFRTIPLVLALHAPALFAAPPVAELKVAGKIDLPNCVVSVGNDGYYDYGRLASTMIRSGSVHTPLEPKTETMTVTCDSKTPIMFRIVDNRESSSSDTDETSFGLGYVNGTGKLGYYEIRVSDLSVDGKGTNVWRKNGNVANGNVWSSANLERGGASFGWGDFHGSRESGRIFQADLTVKPHLGGTTTMNGPLTDSVDLDGSATLVFAFAL
ncbi:DUF1120 domain-containing protein [Burkholderia ubonensis]|uniref:DUF1120 domain-containing protein n=1 Tax=Burkholderia ubonensis TaxID=101571 RepID=A0AB74CYE4_9BURK|nr:DUF1120 domain-containing protein [Burkholderia ubonensis]PAJ77767.1 hypothetical protein CJO71_27055 [Burkholderia ubonensis]PAJ85548.1 hypothetical protein CJO70_22470 [Burkholderia ubonensis]PAJ95178.1 hypothetical protein CJO69_08060 [Burkholderia ubonensis]PAJ99605.1 hypothetical protein CJO68_19070 [Burkholderia ubonensis]PAK06355.1 hypothetical protein CJO67_19530 [Burkholderia ubonensis]